MKLPLVYDALQFARSYVADVIVDGEVLLELKSVERLLPVHETQTRSYLYLSNCRLALLMNFGAITLKEGIKRFVATPLSAA